MQDIQEDYGSGSAMTAWRVSVLAWPIFQPRAARFKTWRDDLRVVPF